MCRSKIWHLWAIKVSKTPWSCLGNKFLQDLLILRKRHSKLEGWIFVKLTSMFSKDKSRAKVVIFLFGNIPILNAIFELQNWKKVINVNCRRVKIQQHKYHSFSRKTKKWLRKLYYCLYMPVDFKLFIPKVLLWSFLKV